MPIIRLNRQVPRKNLTRNLREYVIEGIAGMEHIKYTAHSRVWHSFLSAAGYVYERRATMQDFNDAVAFRSESQRQHSAEHRQLTRTQHIYFLALNNGALETHVAIDSRATPNELLTCANDLEKATHLTYSKRHAPVSRAIDYCERQGTIIALPPKAYELSFTTPIAQDPVVRAHLDATVAAAYQQCLDKEGYRGLRIRFDPPATLGRNEIVIKPALLGPENDLFVHQGTRNYKPNKGFVCGVRYK